MENNNENLRKNLKVNSNQHAFMVERTLAKQDYQNRCREIREQAGRQCDIYKNVYTTECNKVNAAADEACAKAQKEYFDKLSDIAEREDDFKHEVAEYVASLQPKTEQIV